jgi:hypothetical protein
VHNLKDVPPACVIHPVQFEAVISFGGSCGFAGGGGAAGAAALVFWSG